MDSYIYSRAYRLYRAHSYSLLLLILFRPRPRPRAELAVLSVCGLLGTKKRYRSQRAPELRMARLLVNISPGADCALRTHHPRELLFVRDPCILARIPLPPLCLSSFLSFSLLLSLQHADLLSG